MRKTAHGAHPEGMEQHTKELSRREEMSVAGAALQGAPWKAAIIAGGGVAAADIALDLLFGSPEIAWSACLGITLFTLIAAIGAIARPNVPDRVTRQARLWSLRHPFRFALYPAAGAAIMMYPIQLVLDGEGVFGAAWDALMGGVMIYLIAGLLALTLKGRAR
ncbi:hypothetical protein SAMN04489764_1085 [Thermostaphylospora chromogena]|uniref:Uncharacterized protein n=2 Tax=Thermostaphylospora chromogena TaxID=35622 RepID=A0A1H1BSV2_9ACTN|nr:hypothetical protein SAMN04489764_1085 [Thermostaphylospora chromogena]